MSDALRFDLDVFADPWEQVRLLSDPHRQHAILTLLRRRAAGARVLEIGCGTGLWAVVAGRLGARRVIAIEPTPLASLARELVRCNGLSDTVTVIEATVQDLEPEPMDLVFSELLNADPGVEGLFEVSGVAREWLAPGGHLAPSHLSLYAALAHLPAPTLEIDAATTGLHALARDLQLELGPLLDRISSPGLDRHLVANPECVGPPALVWTHTLDGTEPPEVELDLTLRGPSPPTGVAFWWEAHFDRDVRITNAPGQPNHWGQLAMAWGNLGPVRSGVRLRVCVDEDGLGARLVSAY